VAVQPLLATPTAIDGLWTVRMKTVDDERGAVRELFRASALAEAVGAELGPWKQVNVTETRQGAIRGLHGESMHKLVAVAAGEAFGVYVDARVGSPKFGTVVTVELGPSVQVLVPPGVCNGFQSVSPGSTQYIYCFDREWEPDMDGVAVHPLDPALGIAWPIAIDRTDRRLLSAKDAAQPPLAALRAG
jgi:dTDP-4-dehydrorhamnose 3,5-epimerase